MRKLFESIATGVGKIYEPTHLRRIAQAQGDAKLISEAADIRVDQLRRRADEREQFRQTRRQRNVETIAAKAAKYLPESVSEKPVDDDWAYEFFEDAQDTATDELQELWAKILAGEVAQPGRHSKRLLRTVGQMEKCDAERFTRLCSVSFDSDLATFALGLVERSLLPFGLSGFDLNELSQLGLADLPSAPYSANVSNGAIFKYFSEVWAVSGPDGQKATLQFVPLTDRGRQLRHVCDARPNPAAPKYVDEMLQKQNGFRLIRIN